MITKSLLVLHNANECVTECPYCHIQQLEAQVAELQAHRDAGWQGSGGMPTYSELEAKLEAVESKLTEYMDTGDPTAVTYAVQLRRVIQKAREKAS